MRVILVGAVHEPLAVREYGDLKRAIRESPLQDAASKRKIALLYSRKATFASHSGGGVTVCRDGEGDFYIFPPSPSAYGCHRLAAARSRHGSDNTLCCHSLPWRRFATQRERLILPLRYPKGEADIVEFLGWRSPKTCGSYCSE